MVRHRPSARHAQRYRTVVNDGKPLGSIRRRQPVWPMQTIALTTSRMGVLRAFARTRQVAAAIVRSPPTPRRWYHLRSAAIASILAPRDLGPGRESSGVCCTQRRMVASGIMQPGHRMLSTLNGPETSFRHGFGAAS